MPVHVRIFASLLVWDFIASSVERAAVSLIAARRRDLEALLLPTRAPADASRSDAFDLCIKFLLLVILMTLHGIAPSVNVVFIPAVLLCTLVFTMSLCIWLAALTAFYKDVALAIPFILRVSFFLSPIFYEAAQLVPVKYQTWYHLNPVTALIESFNFFLLGTDVFPAGD